MKREKGLEEKRDDIQHEEVSLHRQIGEIEDGKKKLRADIDDLMAKRTRNEALLKDAKMDLREAERKMRDAEKDKDAARQGTVGGAVGAAVLGMLFPPSLAVTVPAVAVAGTISIAQAEENIERSKWRIYEIIRSLNEQEQRIRAADAKIRDIESVVPSLNSRLTILYEQRGQLRNMIAFMQKAVTYFGELQVAVEGGRQRTDLLYKMVKLANKKEEYRILDSKGGITVAGSFAKAWEQVEEKVMSGDAAGYLGIEFVELSQLE